MSVTEAPDGIRIGAEEPGDRLPMLSFDEWPYAGEIGELTAGQVKTVDFGELETNFPTFRGGETLTARLVDPPNNNGDKLLILHAFIQSYISDPSKLLVYVKNIHTSTVDFGTPEFTITGWNTSPTP